MSLRFHFVKGFWSAAHYIISLSSFRMQTQYWLVSALIKWPTRFVIWIPFIQRKNPVFSKEKIILVHAESVIQSQIHNDSIFITSLKFIPFRFSNKSSVKSNLLLSFSLSACCHVHSVPAMFLNKGNGWELGAWVSLFHPIYFVYIIVSFVCFTKYWIWWLKHWCTYDWN